MDIQEQGFWVTQQNVNHAFSLELANKQDKLNKKLLLEQHQLSRELLKEQHEFNEALFKKQASLSKKLASFAFIGVLVGSGITTGYSYIQSILQNKSSQPISDSPKSVHHKEINELSTQMEIALKNVSSPNPTLNQTTNGGSDSEKVTKKERSR